MKDVDLDDLLKAADLHGTNAEDIEYTIGDLQQMLFAAWRVMSREQREEMLKQQEMVELLENPEYEKFR